MIRASRSNRSLNCSDDTLIATIRWRRVSRALYTSPIPPTPMGSSISYGPRRAPLDSCMRLALAGSMYHRRLGGSGMDNRLRPEKPGAGTRKRVKSCSVMHLEKLRHEVLEANLELIRRGL